MRSFARLWFSMLLNDDATRLRHIIEAVGEALGYVEHLDRDEFKASRPMQHSVVRCIEIVGEAASRLSLELRHANSQVPWSDIIGMRNRIVHAYFDIDAEIIWRTAREDFPGFLAEIQFIAKSLESVEE